MFILHVTQWWTTSATPKETNHTAASVNPEAPVNPTDCKERNHNKKAVDSIAKTKERMPTSHQKTKSAEFNP